MATAPTPGASTTGVQLIRLRLRDDEWQFVPSALPLVDKMAVRQATGLPFEAFVSSDAYRMGEDSLAVLVWVARRQDGEPRLALNTVLSEWVSLESTDDYELEYVIDDTAEVAASPPS